MRSSHPSVWAEWARFTRARDTRLDRAVAIKILPTQFSSDPVRKQRFDCEAKTVSHLNHPHICALYDVGNQDGVNYLVMECVEGETLARRLEKGPLPLDQVLKYGAQIADALDKAHRAGIVHRDLKPGNIMLTAAGAKLLDFGLAKPAAPLMSGATLTAAATQTTPVTQEGTIVGTFQYMSPEQVEGKELDGRSDIFSLGAVLGFNRILPWKEDAGYYIGRYIGREAGRSDWDFRVGNVLAPTVRPVGRQVVVHSPTSNNSSSGYRQTSGRWHR